MAGFKKWTPENLAKLKEYSGKSMSLKSVARELGFHSSTIRDQYGRMGLPIPYLPNSEIEPKPKPEPIDPAFRVEGALHAGHSKTWDLINQGLSLEGVKYPLGLVGGFSDQTRPQASSNKPPTKGPTPKLQKEEGRTKFSPRASGLLSNTFSTKDLTLEELFPNGLTPTDLPPTEKL